MRSVDTGRLGENVAAGLLRKQGYKILEQNVRSRLGELDIVAQQRQVICFVEVKTAVLDSAIFPEENVTLAKQRKLIRLAQSWLHRRGQEEQPIRFDVVSVGLGPKGQVIRTRLIQNAFDGV